MKKALTISALLFLALYSHAKEKELSTLTEHNAKLNTTSIAFTENKGQVHDQNYKARPDVLFGAMAGNMAFHLKTTGVSYQLGRAESYKEVEDEKTKDGALSPSKGKRKAIDQQTIYRIDLNWVNANKNFTKTTDKTLEGSANYYTPGCPEGGALNVKSYSGVTLHNLYNGINLHYYEKNGQLKHDYIVAPNANYKQIQLKVEGAKVSLNKNGTLLLTTELGKVEEGAPVVYQNGKQLTARWVIKTCGEPSRTMDGEQSRTISFEIDNYNPSQELIIDPITRVWGTYYGDAGDDVGYSFTTDAAGNLYMAGYTTASSTSTVLATVGAHKTTPLFGNSWQEAFLVKFNASGLRLWGTYYGDDAADIGYSCATDASGNVYMCGLTTVYNSTTLATPGAHQTTPGGFATEVDAFLVKFNTNGVRLWGTYLGIVGNEVANSCATDASGNVYIAGSANYASTTVASPGAHQTVLGGGGKDAFLVKFNSSGVRQWGTFYGGTGIEDNSSCSTDASGNVYLAGSTTSNSGTVIATIGSHQTTHAGGGGDAFLVKFDANGVRQWGTYYGSSVGENGFSCATDATGNVYLSGETAQHTGTAIATPGSHQPVHGGNGPNDAFLVKFNATGVRQWGTFYGDNATNIGYFCSTDPSGNVYLGGLSTWLSPSVSGTLIGTPGSHKPSPSATASSEDAFLAKFNSAGVRQWGTFYGGDGNDRAFSCTADASGNVYLVGQSATTTGTGVATPGSHQSVNAGGTTDAFLVKLKDCVALTPTAAVSSTICAGSAINFTASISSTITPTYNWSGPSSYTSNVQNPSITSASSANIGTYTLTVDNSGCIETSTVSISAVNVSPTITVNSGSVCSGNSFTMTANGASTYTFQGGNAVVSPTVTTSYTVIGTSTAGCLSQAFATSTINVSALPTVAVNSGAICSGQSFTLVPSGASTYTYSSGSAIVSPTSNANYNITGTSAQGCVSSNTAVSSVTVNAAPSISVNSGAICSGQSFTIVPSGATTYTYSGGSAIVSPTSNTSFNVTGTNAQGCVNSVAAVSSVTVNALPTVSVNNGAICVGQAFTLVPSGASTYTYSSGSAIVSPTANANYNVTGTSAQGCVSSNTALSSVTVNALPTISIPSATICIGSTGTLTASGALTYTWSTGSNANAISASPVTTTTYTATGTSSAGCLGIAVTATITVGSAPSIVLNSATVCAGNSATLNASGVSTYTWNTGANSASIVVTPTVNTTYSVSGNLTGCIIGASNTATVVVNALPNVTVSSTNTLLCVGQSATLTATGANSYVWNTTASSSVIAISPSVSTTYTVSGTGANGCVSNVVLTQSVSTCDGIDKLSSAINFNVYPNPTKGSILVSLNTVNENTVIEIYDAIGQLLMSEKVNSNEQVLHLNEFANGIYFVRINNNNLVQIKKVIKE